MRRFFVALSLFVLTVAGLGLAAGEATGATVVLPTVTGGFGVVPTVKFSGAPAPSALQIKVLSDGHGSTVKKASLLVVNYVGQIWNGKVFDSSFSRHEVFGVPIGVGQVVKGWDEGLVGQKIGSRVLLVIPPSLGYGSKGNTSAGISGTDDLVFVVDLVASYMTSTGANESASVVASSSGGVTVNHIVSTAPTVAVTKNTKAPTAEASTLLAHGTGAKVVPGEVVLQYVVTDWTGKTLVSTWKVGTPDGEYVGVKANPSPFDPLVGDQIGSRVLIELPASSSGGPYAVAVQIAAEVPASASKA